ncbi:MAG: sigma 54-interacting transcriptional regulator [Deltaproteobacteria bacterium]
MTKERILVVEDDSILALGIEDNLEEFGYEVAGVVSSGEQAVAKAAESKPDLALMDIMLAGKMNGIEAAGIIRESLRIPIVYLTAHSDPATLQRAKITEPFGYIVKPFDKRELHGAIEMALYKNKIDKKLRENEQWLSTVLSSIAEAVIAADTQGRIAFMNPVAESLTGWKEHEARGLDLSSVFKVTHKTPNPPQNPMAWEAKPRYAADHTNCSLISKNGAEIPIDESAAPIKDAAGNVKGSVVVFGDITERKAAEAKNAELALHIQKNRDDMLSILNQLRIGTVKTDAEGCLIFISLSSLRILRIAQSEVLGRGWEDVFPFEKRDIEKIKAALVSEPDRREKISLCVNIASELCCVDIEIHDDPEDARRKIFFLYDVTEVHKLRRLLDDKSKFHELVGRSKEMQAVYQQSQELSNIDSTVLIEGETGTGKELVARAIHFGSHRKENAFVVVNCAGLTESIVTSQLFGHKKGAFTGAVLDQQGLFEAANRGTIFLDEIGDIPLSVQTSLLRVLQEREITRLGETNPRKIDVRILAATHRNLGEEVEKGRFRSDLLYRIRVARVRLPALRERRGDIPLLCQLFLEEARTATGKSVETFANDAMDMLLDYPWHGNVRELKNAVEFSVIRCRGAVIQPEDLPPEVVDSSDLRFAPFQDAGDEKKRFAEALEKAEGNRTLAARILGMGRTTFYRRLSQLGIKGEN